jgi:hypothetical protein
MTTKKLLTGVALAALLSGGALAQTAAVGGGSDFLPANVIANEGGQDQDGNLVLEFDIDSAFSAMGAGGVVELQITLNDATFNGVVPPGSLAFAGGGDCEFGADPTLGGGSGGDTVTFTSVGQLNNCGVGGLLTITLPISVDFGDQVSVAARFEATADAGGYGPIVNRSIAGDDIMVYGDALSYAIVADATVANGELNTDGDAFLDGLNVTNGFIGTLETTYDNSLFYTPGTDLATALITADDLAASGELLVSFTDINGIDALELDGTDCGAPVGNDFTCAVDTSNTADQDVQFFLAGAPDGTTTQTPTASLSLTADPGANAGAAVFGGVAATDLTEIKLDNGRSVTAITTSAFDWVKVGTGGTESNFRIAFPTAAEAQAVEFVRVVIDNPGNGVAAQTITLPAGDALTGFQVQGATVTFNSRALGAVSPDSGNADISEIELDHNDTALDPLDVPGLEVRRQLVNRSPSSFVATPGLE